MSTVRKFLNTYFPLKTNKVNRMLQNCALCLLHLQHSYVYLQRAVGRNGTLGQECSVPTYTVAEKIGLGLLQLLLNLMSLY